MVIGLNYSAFRSLFANAEGMSDGAEYIQNTYSLKSLTEFIADKPEHVSIMSYNINDPDSGIFYGIDEPRTMGTLGNLFLLIEYERQIAENLLVPTEEVDVEEIERYVLPQVNENAHKGAMAVLTEDGTRITNDEAMSALLEYNSLAISDYFWFKLGEENLRALMDTLQLPHTEIPLPFSGIYASLNPGIIELILESSAEDTLQLLESMPQEYHTELILDVAYEYHLRNETQVDVKAFFEEKRIDLSFIKERDALEFFPQTTARDITSVLEQLLKGEIISEDVSNAVLDKLRWGLDSDTIQRSFKDYGAIYDNRMGMLSGIDFGTSIYDEHTSVQAVFFDDLPVAFWLHMSANHMQEDYQQRLIWDPALFETTLTEITNNQEQ